VSRSCRLINFLVNSRLTFFEFFSTALFPHVLNMVQDKFEEDAILARAIITNRDGTLADAHKGLQSVINATVGSRYFSSFMSSRVTGKRILVLGSGFVSS
jgi:hypothetical protein